jgi:hypothetical protein
MVQLIIQRCGDLFDRLDRDANHHRVERLVVALSALGFLIHLLLICLARLNPELESGVLFGIGRNYLHAVYTPFSFILFYEVLLLVMALPKSLTSSIGKQYEIISLIVVRRVFKDIGSFEDVGSWVTQPEVLKMVSFDMGGALLMFLTVAIFYRVRMTVVKSFAQRNLDGFIAIKKVIALLLGVVLILLATFNLATWVLSLPILNSPLGTPTDIDNFFFPAFFEFMIFTDVFLLIISISYYERYDHVFRNAGFVISTVLLRISLSTPQPHDTIVAVVAMLYGLGVLVVFAYFTRALDAKNKVGTAGLGEPDTTGTGI